MNTKFKIKKGDSVKVISGKDKGKTGKILKLLTKTNKAVVENINMHTKFVKAKRQGQPGQQIKIASPVPISNLMYLDGNKATRIGYKILDGGTKERISKQSGKAV